MILYKNFFFKSNIILNGKKHRITLFTEATEFLKKKPHNASDNSFYSRIAIAVFNEHVLNNNKEGFLLIIFK